jgi:hypothetical protein
MKTGVLIAVVAVVVVAAVLGGLYVTHSGPFRGSGSGTTGGGGGGPGSGSGETYSAAAALAGPSTSSVSGGPWSLAGGVGVATTSAATVNTTTLNTTFAAGLCHPHILSTASSLSSVPSTSASASSGVSNAWVVLYVNSTAGVLEVAVFGGVVTPLLTIGIYGGCGTGVAAVSLPSGYLDSPAAAATAYNNGGSGFVASHSAYDLEEVLVPAVTVNSSGTLSSTPSTWEITYTDCNVAADDGTTLGGAAPAQFTAGINATSGAFIRGFPSTIGCASATGSGGGGGGGSTAKNTFQNVTEDFVFTQQHTSKTTFWNNGSLVTTLTNLTAGGVTVTIENNTTGVAVSTSGMTFQIVNITFAWISVYNFSSNTWNNTGASIGDPLAYTVFSLNSTASLKGEKIVLTATASAPVTGSTSAVLGKA